MAALKRAYADIILNTAKESAARVLAAERKALGFQQSLFAAKEEALATMLRLKALMEDKIREAEKAAMCQAKKIEELELQLGEAEDTIVDLREDLKRVREELIMVKNGSIQPLSEGNINDACMKCNNIGKETSADNLNEPGNMPNICKKMTTLTQKATDTHQGCLQNAEKVAYPEEFSAEVDCPVNTDLASIIWRSKVPELYRKGYRIHALEHNLTSKGPSGESNSEKFQISYKTDSAMSDKRKQVKDVSICEETEQQPGYCKTIETGQEPGCSGKDHSNFSSGFSPRKQRTCKQSNVFSDGIFSDKSKSCSSSSKFIVHDEWNESEAPKETSAPSIQAATEIGETAEGKKSLAEISTERETLMLNQCRFDTSIKIESVGIKQCSERINSRSFQKHNQSVSEDKFLQNSLRNCEDVKDPLLSGTFSKPGSHPSSVAIQEDLEDRIEMASASKSETQHIAENSDNCNTVKSDTNDIANGTGQTGTDKFLKYTFQRKRKKESSPIKNEIAFPEKRLTLRQKSVDKQTSVSAPSKSSVATDLPRNNRRLVQVARQTIFYIYFYFIFFQYKKFLNLKLLYQKVALESIKEAARNEALKDQIKENCLYASLIILLLKFENDI
ncbi:hypothetical protein IEQ34_005717 [Dendrobium chrysotoxum]|uniref:Uncharacterized protein n=1 Tax=Dendrobium chrysotoxum TaxID=161865 RepID=A0AAV7GVV2_DENCH|nr:hypothetical protein IEQ34_005717 [Dendrobium chrysotoxum]